MTPLAIRLHTYDRIHPPPLGPRSTADNIAVGTSPGRAPRRSLSDHGLCDTLMALILDPSYDAPRF